MSIKKKYYQMSDIQFKEYLTELKSNTHTQVLFKNTSNPYYYSDNKEINRLIVDIHKLYIKLNYLYQSLGNLQKQMYEQTCLINEIQSSNKTENIFSTKNDIFSVLEDAKHIHNKKIVSIVNSYQLLKEYQYIDIQSLNDIREIYDVLMENAYDSKKDVPDGDLFRKGPVHITDGVKIIHQGFYPEDMIKDALNEYILVNNNEDLDIFIRLILSHFMIETIHPFYDGNGRLGRFLMSLDLYKDQQSIFSLCIASTINNHKNDYYKALKEARDIHQFGVIDEYVLIMCKILLSGLKDVLDELKMKKRLLEEIDSKDLLLTKSEIKIYKLLYEASILTYYGISNEQILSITKVSKRTLMSTIKKFRNQNLLVEMKLGKVQYHKLRTEYMLNDE